MALCGHHDLAYSQTLLSLCRQIGRSGESTLSAGTAALSIEGMVDGLWQNFLIGPAGFKRKQAVRGIFELIELIYPAEGETIRRIAGQN